MQHKDVHSGSRNYHSVDHQKLQYINLDVRSLIYMICYLHKLQFILGRKSASEKTPVQTAAGVSSQVQN